MSSTIYKGPNIGVSSAFRLCEKAKDPQFSKLYLDSSQTNASFGASVNPIMPTVLQQASHSFIRSAMRKTIVVVEAGGDGGGGGAAGMTETVGGIKGTFEEGCGVGGVVSGDAALHDARIIIDMDRVRSAERNGRLRTGRRRCGTVTWLGIDKYQVRKSKLSSHSTRPPPFFVFSAACFPFCLCLVLSWTIPGDRVGDGSYAVEAELDRAPSQGALRRGGRERRWRADLRRVQLDCRKVQHTHERERNTGIYFFGKH